MRPRIIPVLLVENGGLVKTINFNKRIYLGDPINTVRLFNDMQVDEIVVLDISRSKNRNGPNFSLIEDIRNEAFMPLAYGGGVKSVDEFKKLISIGIEKVVVNSGLLDSTSILKTASSVIGSQSVVASLDINKSWLGNEKVYSHILRKNINLNIFNHIKDLEDQGAGELLLNFVHRDGTWEGYDLELIKKLSSAIRIPLVVCGGAKNLDDLKRVIECGADAAAAGSLFSFQGKDQGVLTNYPDPETLDKLFDEENNL